MPRQNTQFNLDIAPPSSWGGSEQRIASYERELAEHRSTEIRLRGAVVRSEALLCEKEEVIRQQKLLHQECQHRLLNNLNMIASLLSLQSRREENVEAASRLAVAVTRVRAISRLHRQLHSMDGKQTVEFKRYLDKLCRALSTPSMSEQYPHRLIIVEAIELNVPPTTGVPLSLIVNELVTNAIKHGRGQITVTLARHIAGGYALSVCNGGCNLPEDFDPTAGKGLGMILVSSFIAQIGGDLRVERNEDNDSTTFTVLFTC